MVFYRFDFVPIILCRSETSSFAPACFPKSKKKNDTVKDKEELLAGQITYGKRRNCLLFEKKVRSERKRFGSILSFVFKTNIIQ